MDPKAFKNLPPKIKEKRILKLYCQICLVTLQKQTNKTNTKQDESYFKQDFQQHGLWEKKKKEKSFFL